MKKAGQHAGTGGRTITADEAELWERTTRSLHRVKAKPRVASSLPPTPTSSRPETAPSRHRDGSSPPKPSVSPKPRATASDPASFAAFDRREARRLASGKAEIDARIDLHGLRQEQAHARLRSFLLGAYGKGCKTVLVITGKGGTAGTRDAGQNGEGEGQRGVLRRNVPLWLAQPDLAQIVVSYGAAGIRHGGAGALYIRLRSARRSR